MAYRISWYLAFDPENYGPRAAAIFAASGNGARPMELYPKACSDEEIRQELLRSGTQIFPGARDPEMALSGLFLYFSCLNESHDLLQSESNVDCSYWHAIMHRMEGDSSNSGYWFQRVGRHPLFAELHRQATKLGYDAGVEWNPVAFVKFCERAAGSKNEDMAKRVQLAEWQILFDHCAAPVGASRSGLSVSKSSADKSQVTAR